MIKTLSGVIIALAIISVAFPSSMAIQVTDPPRVGHRLIEAVKDYCDEAMNWSVEIEAFDGSARVNTMFPDTMAACGANPPMKWKDTTVSISKDGTTCTWKWAASNDFRVGFTGSNTAVESCAIDMSTGQTVHVSIHTNWKAWNIIPLKGYVDVNVTMH